jgi:hypothetical protein
MLRSTTTIGLLIGATMIAERVRSCSAGRQRGDRNPPAARLDQRVLD